MKISPRISKIEQIKKKVNSMFYEMAQFRLIDYLAYYLQILVFFPRLNDPIPKMFDKQLF